jgi:hypothetical protein
MWQLDFPGRATNGTSDDLAHFDSLIASVISTTCPSGSLRYRPLIISPAEIRSPDVH